MKNLLFAFLACFLLLGCNIDDVISSLPGDNKGDTKQAAGKTSEPEILDADEIWIREFAKEFVDFLNTPYTPASSPKPVPLWYNVYGDQETFYREKAAWEKLGIADYTVSVEKEVLPSKQKKMVVKNNETIYPEIRPTALDPWQSWEPTPSYLHDFDMEGRKFISTGTMGGVLEGDCYNLSEVYGSIAGNITQLLNTGSDLSHYVDDHYQRFHRDQPSIHRIGFKIDYHPQYHYPVRIVTATWRAKPAEWRDEWDEWQEITYTVIKVLSFEPLDAKALEKAKAE